MYVLIAQVPENSKHWKKTNENNTRLIKRNKYIHTHVSVCERSNSATKPSVQYIDKLVK